MAHTRPERAGKAAAWPMALQIGYFASETHRSKAQLRGPVSTLDARWQGQRTWPSREEAEEAGNIISFLEWVQRGFAHSGGGGRHTLAAIAPTFHEELTESLYSTPNPILTRGRAADSGQVLSFSQDGTDQPAFASAAAPVLETVRVTLQGAGSQVLGVSIVTLRTAPSPLSLTSRTHPHPPPTPLTPTGGFGPLCNLRVASVHRCELLELFSMWQHLGPSAWAWCAERRIHLWRALKHSSSAPQGGSIAERWPWPTSLAPTVSSL